MSTKRGQGHTFTLAPAGNYAFVVKGTTGDVVSTQTLKVLGVVADAAPVKVGQLSRTDFDSMPLAVGGGLSVLARAGAVFGAKRPWSFLLFAALTLATRFTGGGCANSHQRTSRCCGSHVFLGP